MKLTKEETVQKIIEDLERTFGDGLGHRNINEEVGFMEITLHANVTMSADKMLALALIAMTYGVEMQVYPIDDDHMNIYMEWNI